jgi:uracil-DNA glycosylase
MQPRRHDARRQEAERAQRRAGQDTRKEAVREYRDEPSLLECHGDDADDRDPAGDEPRRGLVDRIREGEERAHLRLTLPAVTVRKSSYRAVASLQRDTARCRACVEAGFPLESPPVRAPYAEQRAYMYGQAPGIVEGEERLPWRGRAGQTLRRWLALDEDAFYATFFCASVTRCYPGRAASGRGDRTPTPREQDLCQFWRDWELELLRPRLIVTVGGLALKRLLGVPGSLTDCIGSRFELDGIPVVPLPHPSGASSWPNVPSNKIRLERALALVHAELMRI